MSSRRFVRVAHEIYYNKELSPIERLVLGHLVDAQGKNENSWWTQGKIAEKLGCARETVNRALKTLEAAKKVEVVRERTGIFYKVLDCDKYSQGEEKSQDKILASEKKSHHDVTKSHTHNNEEPDQLEPEREREGEVVTNPPGARDPSPPSPPVPIADPSPRLSRYDPPSPDLTAWKADPRFALAFLAAYPAAYVPANDAGKALVFAEYLGILNSRKALPDTLTAAARDYAAYLAETGKTGRSLRDWLKFELWAENWAAMLADHQAKGAAKANAPPPWKSEIDYSLSIV